MRLLHGSQDGRLSAGHLVQPRRLASPKRNPRQNLPPVQLDELLGQIDRVQIEVFGSVVAALDSQLPQRHEQRELVCGDEPAFRQQPLDLEEELDLGLGIGLTHRERGFR